MPFNLQNPFTPESAKPKKRLFEDEEIPKRKISVQAEERLKKAREIGLLQYGEHKIKNDQVNFLIKLEDEIISADKDLGNNIDNDLARNRVLYIFGNKKRIQVDNQGNIIGLTLLNLRINELPKEIKNLRKLDILNCSQTGLRKLPSEIGKLKNLTILHLTNCKLKEIPKEVADLKKLEALFLRDNFLTTIPKEIAALENLKHLDLRGNKFERSERKEIIEEFNNVPRELEI